MYRGRIRHVVYERVDDQTVPGAAELRVAEDRELGPGDFAIVAPPADIHSFTALSDGTYGITVVSGAYKARSSLLSAGEEHVRDQAGTQCPLTSGRRPIASQSPGIDSAAVIDVHAHVRLQATTGAAGRHGPEFGTEANGKPWYRVGNYKLRRRQAHRQPVHRSGAATEVDARRRRSIFRFCRRARSLTFITSNSAEALTFAGAITTPWRSSCELIPDKLGGLAALPMQDPTAARDELIRAVRELGLWGAAIGTEFNEPLHSPALDPVLRRRWSSSTCRSSSIRLPPASTDRPAIRISSASTSTSSSASARRRRSRLSTLIFGGVLDRHPRARRLDQPWRRRVARHGRPSCAGCDEAPWASAAHKKDGAFEALLSRLWFDTHVTRRSRTELCSSRSPARIASCSAPILPDGISRAAADHGPVDPRFATMRAGLLRRDRDSRGNDRRPAHDSPIAVVLHGPRAFAAADGERRCGCRFRFVGAQAAQRATRTRSRAADGEARRCGARPSPACTTRACEVLDASGARLRPETDMTAFAPFIDAAAELGARHILATGDDPDEPRLAAPFRRAVRACRTFGADRRSGIRAVDERRRSRAGRTHGPRRSARANFGIASRRAAFRPFAQPAFRSCRIAEDLVSLRAALRRARGFGHPIATR